MNRLNGTAPLDVYEIASGATIVEGTLVALNGAGKAVSASDTAGLKVIGVAQRVIDQTVAVADGIFSLANDTTNPVTRAILPAPPAGPGKRTGPRPWGTGPAAGCSRW
mgnify:CR=1 FL=1